MAAELVFMMGKFAAAIPGRLRYARNHMWAEPLGERWRFGLTAYAVRLLQDVYFLDWCVEMGDSVRLKQEIGRIESSKAESDLYAPMAGTLVEFNRQLLADPSAINLDNYGSGWLFEIQGEAAELLDPQEYWNHLDAGWVQTQRMIKGQLNE